MKSRGRPKKSTKASEEASSPNTNLISVEDEKEKTPEEIQKDLVKQDQLRLKEVRQKQKQALEELREKERAEAFAAEKKKTQDRLALILEKTEAFNHVVKAQGGSTPKKTKGGQRRREDDEDETTTEGADDRFITRWTTTPPWTMRNYQLEGINWLIKLYDNGINGILADEMGLGKTLQTVSFLCYLKIIRGISGPHLVIVPLTTLGNWEREFNRWVPDMKVIVFQGPKAHRAEFVKTTLQQPFDVCVTTYEVAIIEKAPLNKFKWKYMCIDEAHRIKNENSLLSQVVRLFKSHYRLLITGTPLQNNLHELWSLLNFLLPDIFGSSTDWETWFSSKDSEETDETEEEKKERNQQAISKLHKVIRPFLLRRLKSEVDRKIPPKTEIKLYLKMTALQKEWYKKVLLKDIDSVNSAGGQKTRLQNVLMQLRKVCNHPYLFPGAEEPPFVEGDHLIENSGKMFVLDKLLQKLKSLGSRVLIFSQMTKMLDILEDFMNYRQHQYCRIDGSTAHEERTENIDSFNAEGSSKFVFLLSTRAGGLGINLATADVVILYDSDWNPQIDLQAQDRAHRIGQTKPVKVYRFITEGTVEEKIIERAETKLKLDALVIQQGRLVEAAPNLTRNELLNMIRYGADAIFNAKEAKELTEQDIDEVIAYGQKRTEELDKLFEERKKEMLEWALNGNDESGRSCYNFEIGRGHAFDIGKRERPETNYRDFGAAGRPTNQDKPKKPRVSRAPKQPIIYPHQFYPPGLSELLQKETDLWVSKCAAKNAADPNSAPPDLSSFELTENEIARKNEMLKAGFPKWTKTDFREFIRAASEFGRNAFEDIAFFIQTKTVEEVKTYSAVFWKRYKELPEGERKTVEIAKGESKVHQLKLKELALEAKIETTPQPWFNLTKVTPKSTWTKGEDNFLLCLVYKHGGEWNKIKEEIESNPAFEFDFFFRTRTTADLEKRYGALIKAFEKERSEADLIAYSKKKRPLPPPAPTWPKEESIEEETKLETVMELEAETEPGQEAKGEESGEQPKKKRSRI